ncbi:MAG: EAL domain-containing protein [Eubacterium sp.]|nr:EAL domain-containing protein [Eubacterium sp.]
MERTESLSCSWLLVDASKELTRKSTLPSETIHTLMTYLSDSLHLVAIRLHQPAVRENSTQVTYELLNDNIPRRLNQVITFPADFVKSMRPGGDRDYLIYDSESDVNPVQGEINVGYVSIFLRHVEEGEFLGLLELVFKDENRYPSERDISVLQALKELLFEQVAVFEKKRRGTGDVEDDEVLDYLSGLHRYESFVEKIDRIIPDVVDENHGIVILCTDINHFKLVNENMGYKKGDELLRLSGQMAASIENLIDACRYYSDNFIMAIRVENPDDDRIRARVEGENQRNAASLQKVVGDSQIRFNSGVYIIRNPKMDAASAISYANTARKQAKVFKGVHCVVFTEKMIEELRRSEQLNNELPNAIKNRNLKVFYQPKISCENERLIGAEALIRWQRDDGSFIYPDQFIPEFESNGNIIQLDYFVYDEVFRFIRNRLDRGLLVVPISMNVSRRHLENEDILFYIDHLFNKYDVPAEFIEFELTENIYIDNIEPALHFITRCNHRGIKVSMDDFGSGYSSLNMISEIPIDVLKIDGVFMHRGKTLNHNDKVVLNNVIRLGKDLKMIVLCEGVETREQVDFLKEAGCDIIQGYFFGKPMPESDFTEFMSKDA